MVGTCSDIRSMLQVTRDPGVAPLRGILEITHDNGDKRIGKADTGRVLISRGVNTYTVPDADECGHGMARTRTAGHHLNHHMW